MDYKTLNLLLRCNKEFSHKKIRAHELSDTECLICSHVYTHQYCSQDDIVNALKIDKTTIGKALASLEKRNYIKRIQDDDDKRFKRVVLTDLGNEKIQGLINLHDEWLAEILKVLSDEEKENFENYCDRLLSAAEKLNESKKAR